MRRSPSDEAGGRISQAGLLPRACLPGSTGMWPSAGHGRRLPPTPLASLPPSSVAGTPGTGSPPAGSSPRRARAMSADGGLFAVPPAGRSGRCRGPGEFPVQRADERADEPGVAAEVPQPRGARSRTEVHPRLRLRVEPDADHHVARAARKVPPREGLNDAFLLVPPAGVPARQFTANQVESGFPYLSEGNGIGAAHETAIGGVGRCSGSRRQKRALETTGK